MENLTSKQKEILFTAKGDVRVIIKNKMLNANGEFPTMYRTGYTSGSGRFTSNASFKNDLIKVLNAFGLKYKEGNDAARGGATGEFVSISSRAAAKLNKAIS